MAFVITEPRRNTGTQRKAPSRPRVPLPRQKGGAHEDKTKRPHRQRKHRKQED